MTKLRLFKELNSWEIEKVVSSLYGSSAKIIHCHLMKGGVFNTTYLVRTDVDVDGIVLRVAPINQHLLLDFEKSMMSAEPLFYALLMENNIPTSEVIHYDNSSQVIDREYIVFKYIDSLPMNDPSVLDHAKPGLYQQLGEVISALHSIESEKFGWKRPDDALMMFDDWGAFLGRFANEIADKTSNCGIFSDGEINKFLKIFGDTKVFNQVTRASMIHADLWEGNVLVREIDGKWEVAAVIDIDKAIFGDKEMEFASPLMLTDDFIYGYGYEFDESSESIYRKNTYNLLGNFMYAYIWFAQYGDMDRFRRAKQNGLDVLDLLK